MLADEIHYVDPRLLISHERREVYHSPFQDTAAYRNIENDESVYHPLIVQKGSNIILDGHMRHQLALERGFQSVPVRYVDVDDIEAEKILITENQKRQGSEEDPIIKANRAFVLKTNYGLSSGQTRKFLEDSQREVMTDEQIADFIGVSRRQLYKYYALYDLIQPLKNLVSKRVLSINGGSMLSKLPPDVQRTFFDVFQNTNPILEANVSIFIEEYKTQEQTNDRLRQLNLLPDDFESISEGGTESNIEHNQRPVNTVKSQNLIRAVNEIDKKYTGPFSDDLESNQISSSRTNPIQKLADTMPEMAESYQLSLLDQLADDHTKTISKVERELFQAISENLLRFSREHLEKYSLVLERFLKKIEVALNFNGDEA